jgi:proline iminopeptidase
MTPLYPEITPFQTFWLATENTHQVYIEQSGHPQGIPVIFLHGGPCSGTKPDHRRFFDPDRYHIILMDQRGCGLSTPFGRLEDNHTQGLIDDMEAIRQKLGLNQWLLFGGSWGATLALLYAEHHPDKIMGMILRGSFLARKTDMDWFFSSETGVSKLYPERWQILETTLKPKDLQTPFDAMVEQVFSEDPKIAQAATKQWQDWGGQVALGNEFQLSDTQPSEKDILQTRMELHYAKHHYFIDENQILTYCHRLQHIRTILIHGQLDLTCPLESAWRLKEALPHAELIILPNSGHIAKGDEMVDALVQATDRFADQPHPQTHDI